MEGFKISREGRSVIPAAGVVCTLLAVGFMLLTFWIIGLDGLSVRPGLMKLVAIIWMAVALVMWLFVVWFFRVPTGRPSLEDEGLVFAPCDGKVVIVRPATESEVTGEQRIQVSVFMSMTNVHLNWFPVGGRVTYFRHHNGHYHVAWHPKASEKNEHTTVAVASPHGVVVFRQIAGIVARRIVSYVRSGADVRQNTPCGFIKFGSRMDVFLPADAEALVTEGQRVRGSVTPIARFAQ